MNRIKLAFIATALVATASAFVPQAQDPCAGQQLFSRDPVTGEYEPALPGNQGCQLSGPSACKHVNIGSEQEPNWVECDTELYGFGPYIP